VPGIVAPVMKDLQACFKWAPKVATGTASPGSAVVSRSRFRRPFTGVCRSSGEGRVKFHVPMWESLGDWMIPATD